MRVSSRFQEWTTAVKFLAFLALVVACFAHAAVGAGAARRRPEAALPALTLAGVVIALQAIVITYGGWQSALYFTEEDRDPRRNLPRAMIGGVLAVIVIYLLVNLALLAVLPMPELARSTLPAADAARSIFGGRGRQLITLLSLVSLPPLLNAILMIGTRILFAMGRDGLLWRATAAVNAGGTPASPPWSRRPWRSLLIATGTFQKLIAVASFFLAANYCVVLPRAGRPAPARAGARRGRSAPGAIPGRPRLVLAGRGRLPDRRPARRHADRAPGDGPAGRGPRGKPAPLAATPGHCGTTAVLVPFATAQGTAYPGPHAHTQPARRRRDGVSPDRGHDRFLPTRSRRP